MGKVICINNNKGGVLKTTTTSNLAGVLSAMKKKVLVIDADNQSNVSISFGYMNPEEEFRSSLYDILCGGVPAEDSIVHINKYIDLIPSTLELVHFEWTVIGDRENFPQPFILMKKAFDHLRDKYDYILIDTPPSLGLMNYNVFSFADHVIIPFEPEAFAMRSLIAVTDTVETVKKINPNLKIEGVFFTKVVHNSSLHEIVKQGTRQYSLENGYEAFENEIPRTVTYANSVGFDGKPITMVNPKHIKSQVYFDLWKEIERVINNG